MIKSLALFAIAMASMAATAAEPTIDETPTVVTLPAATIIPLRMLESVGSNTHQRGASFQLAVIEDVLVDGQVVIPAGAIAQGEVIHANKSGIFGKPGELSVTSRFVSVDERQVGLKSLLASTGKSRINAAYFPPAALVVKGGAVVVAEGTELLARTAADEQFQISTATPTEE